MQLELVRRLAESLMRDHHLAGWSFKFDRSRRRFGICLARERRIQLSRPLTLLNDELQVRDTILHEIAHALAYLKHGVRAAHDRRWKKIATGIGADPKRCYDTALVETPQLPFLVKCTRHGILGQRARRWRGLRSCSRCHRGFNPAHIVTLVPNPGYSGKSKATKAARPDEVTLTSA